MLRYIIAVILGLILGGIVNMGIVQVSVAMHPMPEGTDMNDPEALKVWIAGLPTSGFLMALLAHQAGTFVAGVIASVIAQKKWVVGGIIVGAVFMLGGIIMIVQYPGALWFAILDVLLYVPSGVAGAILGGKFVTPKPADVLAAA